MRRSTIISVLAAIILLVAVVAGALGVSVIRMHRQTNNAATVPTAAQGAKDIQPAGQGDVDRSQPAQAYDIGYRLGQCLVQEGCQVFTGKIRSIGAPVMESGVDAQKAVTYRKLTLDVDAWLLGGDDYKGENVELLSATKPDLTKISVGPWTAWEGARLTVDGRLLVALWGEKAQRPQWQASPEKVALVTSDAQSFEPLKELAQRHKQYEQRPEELSKAVQDRNELNNQYFLGYIMAYLKEREELRDVNHAALLFSSLLRDETLPDSVRSDINFRLLGDFYRLSPEQRKIAAQSLVAAGTGGNSHSAEDALDTLIRLSDDKLIDLRPILTRGQRSKLIERYQSRLSRSNGVSQTHHEFESQLGIETHN
jgi:hypothetical protein